MLAGILAFYLSIGLNEATLQFCRQRLESLGTLTLQIPTQSVVSHYRQNLHRPERPSRRSPSKLLSEFASFVETNFILPTEILKAVDSLLTPQWTQEKTVTKDRERLLKRLEEILIRNFDWCLKATIQNKIQPEILFDEFEIGITDPRLALAVAESMSFFLQSGIPQLEAAAGASLARMERKLANYLKGSEESENPALRGALNILQASEALVLVNLQRDVTNRLLEIMKRPNLKDEFRKRFAAVLENNEFALLDTLEAEAFLLVRADKPPIPSPEDMIFRNDPSRERLLGWIQIKDPILYFNLMGSDPDRSRAAQKIATLLFMEADYLYRFPSAERRRDINLIFARYPEMLEILRRTAQPTEWAIERRQSR